AFRNRPAVDPRTLMVATLHAPAGLVKRPARGETPIFVAARIAERKSRKSAPVFAIADRLFPTISAVGKVGAIRLRRSRCDCSRGGCSSSGSARADAAIALIERRLNGR